MVMRVAIYHNQLSGGAARVIEAYARHLSHGHELELFAPATADTGFVDLEPHVMRTHRFALTRSDSALGRYRRAAAIGRYGRAIAAAIDARGFDAVFANSSYVTQAAEILPFLRTPSLYYAPEPLRVAYEQPAVPAVRSPRSRAAALAFAPYERRRKRFDRRAIVAATRIFTHSQFTRANLERIYGVKAEVVHLGVDAEVFRPLGLARERSVISVGALHPLKGHQFVIDALATIPAGERPALTVVGSRGHFGAALRRHADRSGVALAVEHDLATATLVERYNRASVMVAAQYSEPFGLVTLEALACETPVVAIEEGGLPETVLEGVTGLLRPRDARAVGEAVRALLGDESGRDALGQAGRREALRKWRWAATANRIQQLLESVAAS